MADSDVCSFLDGKLSELGFSDDIIAEIKKCLTKEIGVEIVEDLYDIRNKDLPKKGLGAKQKRLIIDAFKEISPNNGEMFDRNVDNSLSAFINCCGVNDEKTTSLVDYFNIELDIRTIDDLKELDSFEDSIYDAVFDGELELSIVDINRFLRLKKTKLSPSGQGLTPSVANPSLLCDEGAKDKLIQVHYINCQYIFEREECHAKTIVDLNPDIFTMKQLRSYIIKTEGFDLCQVSVELYSKEGYPLSTNECTSKKTLKEWKIENDELLYIFLRKIKQPNLISPGSSLDPLDHELGSDEIVVLTQFNGTFKICVNSMSDPPEDLYRKIANVTGLPTTMMTLYIWNYEKEMYKPLTILQSGLPRDEKIILVLSDPYHYQVIRSAEYGKKSYNMMVQQTDEGISKFFSILRFMFLKHKMTVDVSKLLDYLAETTKCPPLIYALRVLYENSFLSLPLWVALVEGCYQLFKAWLLTFCDVAKIEFRRVFEFSDYFWSAIIKKSKGHSANLDLNVERMSLICPISHIKIFEPVSIPGSQLTYDKRSLCKAIKDGEVKMIPGFSGTVLDESQIYHQISFDQPLMANPWSSDKEVYVWKTDISQSFGSNKNIPCPKLPCKWNKLAECLEDLCIIPPDRLFGMESLTFRDTQGHLVMYMGFTKDVGDKHKLYDPLTHEYIQEKRDNLMKTAESCKDKNVVSKDLTKLASIENLDALQGNSSDEAKPKPITIERVKWDPEEAIMVLLDTSGSMALSLLNEGDRKLTRCDAATAFFAAFIFRTQAYNLQHSIGLIQFSSEIVTKLPIDMVSSDFEKELQNFKPGGFTSLNTAMMDAGKQLVKYAGEKSSIRKCRILCLTDGDNSDNVDPVEVAQFCIDNHIVVDTVFIGGSRNTTQKAITHATGGVCLTPKTPIDGLKIFEMEPFLSLKARRGNNYRPKETMTTSSFNNFKDTTKYPFDEKLECADSSNDHMKTVSPDKVHTLKLKDTNQRVMTELRDIAQYPLPYFEVFPCEERITLWMVLLRGPDSSPYYQGVFRLQVEFPPNYPSLPPLIRFCTPIYHCNINSAGRICHRVLAESYSPSLSMKDILGCIFGLLLAPDPADSLDSVIGNQLAVALKSKEPFDQTDFWMKAKEETSKNADKRENYAAIRRKLSGEQ